MIYALYWIVLTMMTSLVPAQDPMVRHGALATAIVTVAFEEPPLFKNDESRVRTTALLVAIAFRESSLQTNIVGDGGRSVCAFQIYGGNKALLEDPEACVRKAYHMLQESIRIDRENPVAFYARGPRYQSREARRLSADRVAVSQRLLRGLAPR